MRRIDPETWSGLAMLLVCVAVGTPTLLGGTETRVPLPVWGVLFAGLLVACLAAVLWADRRPKAAWACYAAAVVLGWLTVLSAPGAGWLPILLVFTSTLSAYVAPRWMGPVVIALNTAVVAATAGLGGASLAAAGLGALLYLLIQAAALLSSLAMIREQRLRRELAEAHVELRAASVILADSARAHERLRIARELHDIVAHHMSVVSVQAGLAQYVFSSDPGTARTALDTIATSSSAAQEEMRRLLAVLRVNGDGPGYAPAPGIARLNELAERVRTAGVPVEVKVRGVPRPVGPGVDQCVYRVVQESLTNVLKHAGPAGVLVDLEYAAAGLTVRVSDDGAGPGPGVRPPDAGGHGLPGMRERATLYGGTVVAGPRPQGGFEVVLTLPLPPAGGGNAQGELE